jgi:hypothetical protein
MLVAARDGNESFAPLIVVRWIMGTEGTASLPVGGLGGRPSTPDPGTSSGSPVARAPGPLPNWGLRGGPPHP